MAQPRRLVVCADGTWNHPDEHDHGVDAPTNVVKMSRAVMPVDDDGVSQIAFYHEGVGTHGFFDKLLGGSAGEGLDRVILDCYRFLVHNYVEGDEIYLFGFSRGAYTVRSLAGLVRNSGLLRSEYDGMASEAFSLYRDRDPDKHPNSDIARRFRAQYSFEPGIECVGVWDTVGALGLPVGLFEKINYRRFAFHDVQLSSTVRNAFQALAVDERRKPFEPTLWEQPQADADANTNWLEQAWFAGVHSNVGGGYADSGLSDQAFQWMIERVQDRCALAFNAEYVARQKASAAGRLYDSMRPLFAALGEFERRLDGAAEDNAARGVNTWEYVHESVKARCDDATLRPPYGPHNVTTYFQREKPKPSIAKKREALATAASAGNGTGIGTADGTGNGTGNGTADGTGP